jgi:NitT/TauT family transport system substrate-binding protein
LSAGNVRAEDLPKVRFIMPGATFRPYLNYVYGGELLGFNKKLGLTADYNGVQGSSAAVQLVLAGEGDIAHLGMLDFILAKIKQPNLPVRLIYCQDYTSAYVMAVPENSKITSITELKGKSIGVLSIASGAVLTAKSQLRLAGVDPNDVNILPTGTEAGAMAAMRTGQVDALNYHIGTIGVMENMGAKFRTFAPRIPSTGYLVSDRFLAKNRDLVVKAMQAVELATIFMLENPTASVRTFYKAYGTPQGDAAKILEQDVHVAKLNMAAFRQLNETRPWGELTQKEWDDLVAFSGPASGLTSEAKMPTYFDASLIGDINKIDTNWATTAAKAALTQ